MSGAMSEAVDADVVVVGAGVGGLTVAVDLARAGLGVIVCEGSDRVGGLLRQGTVAGVDLDLGAESFATRTDAVAALVRDVAPGLEVVAPRPGGAFLAVATADGPLRAPLPRRTVLGIPADPFAPDVVALIGPEAAARAGGERELPRFALGERGEPNLYDLVAARSGAVVAARLVDTLCRSVYSRPAAQARLSELHPGMWRALLEHGSLLAAAERLAQPARAGAAVAGIAGGVWRLPVALAGAAESEGVRVITGAPVRAVRRAPGGALVVETGETGAGPALRARRVVVATGAGAADRLLAAAGGVASPAEPLRVVAAAVDHAGLDAFPVGSGVIVDPALPSAAKALTHVNAKWPWAQAALPPHRHLVRLSARGVATAGADAALDSPAAVARALTVLTGVDIAPRVVVEVVVQDWADAVAPDVTDPGTIARHGAEAARGIHRTGAAVAGTGLAAVVPHARALAARLASELTRDPHTAPTTDRTARSLA